MNSQTVTVNLVPGLSTPAVVKVSQGDIGRPITFRIVDGDSSAVFSTSTVVTIVGTKPSGLGFSEEGILSNSAVNVNTTLSMTQEPGLIPCEIRFAQGSTDIGTANFILAVEPSPHPEGTTDGTQETMQNLETRLQGEIDGLDSRVTALEAGGGGSGLTDDIKTALLQIAQKVAYIDAHGQDYYDDLYNALYNDTTRSVLLVLSHVSSTNSASTVEVGDSYTTTLTASENYTLNTVSVTMGGVDVTATVYSSGTISIPSVTGNIVITATAVLAAQSITATYTQSGTVYDTASLDSLKTDLVVTANYAGGTSETVPASDYTLSGTLTAGTSTITVSYAGLTTTFNVTVSQSTKILGYIGENLIMLLDGIANGEGGTHNSTISALYDASGNSHGWEPSKTTVTASANALVFDKTASLKPTWTSGLDDIATVEIVTDVTSPGTTACLICGIGVEDQNAYEDTTVGTLSVKTSNILHRKGSTDGCIPITSGRHTYSFVNDNGTWIGYKDGTAVTFGTTTVTWTTGYKRLGSFLGKSGGTYEQYFFEGSIYSLRYYSAALSSSDIASNYANDVSRFS